MPPEPDLNAPYFESPARTERLQLLLHLARNTDTPVYLRGPEGAGKTRLMNRLRQELQEERVVAWVDLAEPVKLVAAVIQQFGLPPEAADDWPRGLTQTLGPRASLIVVDGADNLDPATRSSLVMLPDSGIRLILIGRGGGVDDWDVQFVDLPPFDAVETAAFLRGQAGIEAARITDELAATSYESTHGWPGALLEVLHGLANEQALSSSSQMSPVSQANRDQRSTAAVSRRAVPGRGRRFPWAWLGAGVLGALLAAVLVFQDRINALIAPPEAVSSDVQPRVVPAEAPQPIPAQTADQSPGTAQLADVAGNAFTAGADDIALPVPDRPAEDADTSASPPDVDDAVESLLTPLTELEDQLEPASPSPDASDPLDDVLKDALAAVEAQQARPEETHSALAAAEEPALAANKDADTPADAEPLPTGAKKDDSAVAIAAVPTAREAPVQTVSASDEGPRAVSAPPVLAGSTTDAPGDATRTDDPVKVAESVARSAPAPVEQRTASAPVETGRDRDLPVRREAASEGPAPVEDRTGPGRAVNRQQVAEKAVGASTAEPSSRGSGERGDEWLRSRPSQHFTLQLVGARDRGSVEKFVKVNRISPPYAIFRRTLDGADWFSLIAGEYPDRDAAIAARGQLPEALQATGVWPRTFESVQTAR